MFLKVSKDHMMMIIDDNFISFIIISTIDLAQSALGDSNRYTSRLACSQLPLALSRLAIDTPIVLDMVKNVFTSRQSISDKVHLILHLCTLVLFQYSTFIATFHRNGSFL